MRPNERKAMFHRLFSNYKFLSVGKSRQQKWDDYAASNSRLMDSINKYGKGHSMVQAGRLETAALKAIWLRQNRK